MTDQRNLLELFAGEWVGEENIEPSKWGEGGRAIASVSARLDLGGRVLIHDYNARRDGKPWLNAHAVITFDEHAQGFGLFWFDSLGFMATGPAPGEWTGTALCFVRTSPRGQTRHSYIPDGANAYGLVLESSFDAGATWVPVMQGRYTRVAEGS